ncbi:SGNH/GDSL hydrolase family protein [Ancylobacter terrae]|uniref:SGNH/GDSL hydrolase family protein n=1 Tax=Ancylobacter sp. sgz301288 TaxID=3342077 RepID=UPI00385999DA
MAGVAALAAAGLLATALLAGKGLRYFFEERSRLRLEPVFTARFAAANAALPAPKGKRLVLFGDSRAVQLAMNAPDPDWEVVERAISGESTAQMRYRFAADVLAPKPQAVVIFAGINDLVAAAALPELRQAATQATITNLSAFVAEARAAEIEVVLLTIVRPAAVRLLRRPIWSDTVFDLVAQTNERLRALAGPGVRVIDADTLLAGREARLPGRYATDEIHLNAEANAVLRAAIATALERVD